MTLALAKSQPPNLVRAIVLRTRGRTHGPVTRLMSPSDLGELLKPFVFLDLFDHAGAPFNGPLHPHSGIATLTYVAEGAVSYIDPDDARGTLPAGGVEWMQAGRGMWHGGGLDKAGRTRGFQLWIALPPELELGPTLSIYQAPEAVPQDGPVRVLLGSYGSAMGARGVQQLRETMIELQLAPIRSTARRPRGPHAAVRQARTGCPMRWRPRERCGPAEARNASARRLLGVPRDS